MIKERRLRISLRAILTVQAVYYTITGLWPILHIQSFLAVSGPKSDLWLVKMVGLLTASIAVTLFYCSNRDARTGVVLGICSAAAFTIIDVYYVLSRVIPVVYLADAVVELSLIAALLFASRRPHPMNSVNDGEIS